MISKIIPICVPKNNIVQLCVKLRATLCYKKKSPRPSATPPEEEKPKKEICVNLRLRSNPFHPRSILKTQKA